MQIFLDLDYYGQTNIAQLAFWKKQLSEPEWSKVVVGSISRK